MVKKLASVMLCLSLALYLLAGCGDPAPASQAAVPAAAQLPADEGQPTAKTPKYVFTFIGDGMSHVQVNAAQVYRGNNSEGEIATGPLNFTQFPVAGVATTHDSTSFCPDSASTATAISCGVKTHSGVLGLEADKTTRPQNIAEKMKKAGWKVGIVSSVTINHATPAAFYAHVPSRNQYYDIALQMADSGFDYFAGGSINSPTGEESDQADIYGVLKERGYTIADTKEDIRALNAAVAPIYAVSPELQDDGAMPYALDTAEDAVTLAEFVEKGIEVLDNDTGFFMMCESGKVDWSCHANDAMSAIKDVLAFEEAIQKAVDFANQHPEETLILVTGDHETGGMTIGYAATGYDTAFDILDGQQISYVAFDELVDQMKEENPALTLADVLPVIKKSFGLMTMDDPDATGEDNAPLVFTDYEYEKLAAGFAESMKAADSREESDETLLLYGGYDPLSVSLTHIINNKAGIGWTSYAHTGTPVPVYATGAGSEAFNGSYDNTDIFHKLVEVCGL